ncbi:hypothetical protein [Dinghuibacter silviterrae]|uniref:Outer membrane protein with beta-barrel domain n=1 Tax=Dinghuibacter silviterrae TaxID=1539049 RepID=A0A4R8DFT5_9BACT|nr:hypothetical protein [Dinghuibacter silviterrae]TDW96335.1 hypothetical protein EDB95_4161 [Dinghuibacter silviterrae]
MKQPLLLCLAALFTAYHSTAQTKGSLSLSLGPAIPVGAFASKNDHSANTGLANVGPLADLTYQHPIGSKSFGWMASLRGRFNGVDRAATLQSPEDFFPGYEWTLNRSRWTVVEVVAGSYFQRPLTKRLHLFANIELGVAEAWSPRESILGVRDSVGYGYTDMVVAHLSPASRTTFTGLAGVGVCYRWRGRWSLLGRVDFTYLEPTFKNVQSTLAIGDHLAIPSIISLSNAQEVSLYSYSNTNKQPMNSVDVSAGLALALK